MEDNEKSSQNGESNWKMMPKQIKEAKEVATEATKLAASVSSGNVVESVKSAAKLAKSKMVKKRLKRNLMMICSNILVIVIIAVTLISIFSNVVEKLMELASNLGKAAKSFWNWLIDDYWIRLDDDIEYTTTDNTRPGSHEERHFGR